MKKELVIKTKYVPATDLKGARMLAKSLLGIKSIPYPYELSGEDVHRKAAQAWINHHLSRQGWENTSRFKLKSRYCDKKGYSFLVHT